MKTLKPHRRWLMVAYLATIGIALLLVNSGISAELRNVMDIRFPLNDKLAHFFLIGGLAYLLPFALLSPNTKHFWLKFTLFMLVLTIGVTVEEYSQRFLATRSFQRWDLIADYLGITCFASLYLLTHKSKRTLNKKQYERT